ncbi:hypothetical protein ACFL01_02765 [Planctomycetota bacterium]
MAPQKKKSRDRNTLNEGALFAWKGICVTLPRGWAPAMIQDKGKSGYVRIEDREAVRMELRWNMMQPGYSTSVDRTIEEATRNAKKAGENIAIRRDLSWKVPREMGGEFFSIGGDWNAYYLLATRGDMGVYLRVMGEPGEDITAVARETLESLRLSAGARTKWAVFGLEASLPAEYEVGKHSFVTGHICLDFASGINKLTLNRYSLADSALGDKSLEEWLKVKNFKLLDNYRAEAEPLQMRSHRGVRLKCTKKLRLSMLRKPKFLNITGWVCDTLNRMYVVMLEHNGDDDTPEIVKGITCH